MTEEIKLVTSLHKKRLTPVEEAQAFAAYLKTHDVTPDELAKRLNKPARYVEERLLLNGLSRESVKALVERKIDLGHAQLVAQLRPDQQKACIREIVEQEYTVQQFSDVVRFNPRIDFGDLPLRLQERWGGSQTTLDCAELLETKTAANSILQAKMKKELAEYLAAEREKVRAKGITVFASRDDLVKQYPKAEVVTEYGKYAESYDDVLKELPNSKRFVVVIAFDDTLEKTVYCVAPDEYWTDVADKRKAQEARKQAKKSRAQVEAERANADELLSRTREERLRKNVVAYRHEWMIEKVRSLTAPGSVVAKAAMLQLLLQHLSDGWKRKPDEYGSRLAAEIAKAAGHPIADEDLDEYSGTLCLSDCLSAPTNELDGYLHRAMLAYAHQQDDEWLNATINALRLDYTKEFALTSEYLDLYTKEQLLVLAKEAKITSITAAAAAKKPTLIDAILTGTPNEFVPKEFSKAGKLHA
jgi:hypothetical protein